MILNAFKYSRFVSMKYVVMVVAVGALFTGAAQARLLGQLEFKPCELKAPRGGVLIEAECAQLTVLENSQAPQGRRLDLRIVLIPAKTSKPKSDPVVLLAGGPGQAASEAYPTAAAAFAPLRRERHVLLLDQRGTGKNNPLFCPFPDWKSPASSSPELARTMARDCRRDLEKKADLRFYTTSDYIRDLESVRAALGGPQFNLVGGSYGTRVALEYLRRNPDALRSVFIDSVAPPELVFPQDHARNLEEALERMSARCYKDAACGKRYGDLLQTLRGFSERLRRKPEPVRYRHPLTNEWSRVDLTRDTLMLVMRMFSYAPESLSLLPLLIDRAASGEPEALMAQAELMMDWVSDALAHGMELSVICAEDEPWLKLNPADASTLMGGEIVEFTKIQCAEWPRGEVPEDFKQPVMSDKPVLLLSGEFDPVTPPRYAAQVAKTLSNSRTLLAKGQGHTPMGVGCMPRLLREFVDTLKPKELEAQCLEVLGDTPFFLGYEGPAP